MARAFAREGANVHLVGLTHESLEELSGEIRSAGGVAETARVDALDETAVDRHADAVAASAGGIDISFNLISVGDVQGTPLAEMPLEDFERPIDPDSRQARCCPIPHAASLSTVTPVPNGDT